MHSDLILHSAERPGDIAALRAFLTTAGDGAAEVLDQHLARPRYRPALTRIAERSGAIVGCALLSHQRLRVGRARIDTGAFERFVAPDDEADRAALLGDCLGALLESGLPLATLHGDPSVYGPFGFAAYRLHAQARLFADPGAALAPLRPAAASDLADLAALYEASYGDLALATDRAAPDWRDWLAAGPPALVLEDSRGRVVAYALTQETGAGDMLSVAEAAAADAGAARLLLAALGAHGHTLGRRGLELALPPGHRIGWAALHMGGEMRLVATPERSADAPLAGVVDLVGMLEALIPALERRLERSRYAGWSGNLRIEIETERVVLAFDSGRAAVIDGSRPADVRLRRVTLPALAQLCLGYRSAADLRATGGLACEDSTLGLIDALFSDELLAGSV